MTIKSAICLLAICANLNACGETSQRWGEEVQLSDGRVIVIERESVLQPGGDEWVINRAGVKLKEVRLRFAAPDGPGKTIRWNSTRHSADTWPEKPLILDIEAGRPVLFSSVYVSQGCEVFLKYRYDDGHWTEQALPDRFEQRTTNLLIRDGIDMPKFVSLQEKRLANARGRYRRSLRHVGPDRKICG